MLLVVSGLVRFVLFTSFILMVGLLSWLNVSSEVENFGKI